MAQARWWLFVGLLLCLPFAQARGHHHSYDDAVISVVALSGLPVEARNTFQLIKQGGPFPYPRDGVVFGNREHQLPPQPRGYYHEYTVKTPGAHNRGARRIVCGVVPECYYTDDHYQTFKRIKE
jgi:ribonuclease T1